MAIKVRGDAGLIRILSALKLTDSLSSENIKFSLGSSLDFSTSIVSFNIIVCSANCIAWVFTQLANSSSSMAQSLASKWSIFDPEGNAIFEWVSESSTIEEGVKNWFGRGI